MSVSIDEDPADEHEGEDESARGVLAGWLDDYAAGRCERADMEEAFMSVCAGDSEAPWDAIALLDQYQRLGRVDAALARALKQQITQLAVGAPKPERTQDIDVVEAETPVNPPHVATEQIADAGNTDDIAIEPPSVQAMSAASSAAATTALWRT